MCLKKCMSQILSKVLSHLLLQISRNLSLMLDQTLEFLASSVGQIFFFKFNVGLHTTQKVFQVMGLFAPKLFSKCTVRSEYLLKNSAPKAFTCFFDSHYYVGQSINVCAQRFIFSLGYSFAGGYSYPEYDQSEDFLPWLS